jgi:ankyrin repeat protein
MHHAPRPAVRSQTLTEAKHRREELVHAQLCTACGKGDYEKVRRLITSRSIDIDYSDFAGRRALHLAACGGDKRVIELLIASRADVNVEDVSGSTPLTAALLAGDHDVAELLVKHGAHHGSRNVSDEVCAVAAEAAGSAELRRLCKYGGNVNASNRENRTPLHIASSEGRIENATLLIAAKADVNARDGRGATCLHDAVLNHQDAICELLLEHGATLGESFDQALHLNTAAMSNDTVHLTRLLRFRCSINAQDALGRSPLHLAASNRRLNALSLLLDTQGIEVNIEDGFGNTPYDDALREVSPEQQVVVALFISRGAKEGSHTRRAESLVVSSKLRVEDERSQEMAKLIAARSATLLQTQALSTWTRDEREAVRQFRSNIEKAVKLEASRGAVLADEHPELWEHVYGYAEGYFEWRDEALRGVLPLVREWQKENTDFASTCAQKLQERVRAQAREPPSLRDMTQPRTRFKASLPLPPHTLAAPFLRVARARLRRRSPSRTPMQSRSSASTR